LRFRYNHQTVTIEKVLNMRKPTSLKWVSILVVLVVLIASVVSFAYFFPHQSALKLSGEVEAKEIRNASRFGGRVKKILVKEGQNVKRGDLLILFDDAELQAKIADAKATLSQALAQEQLLAKGADLGQVRQAGASVQQAQERLKMISSGARPDEMTQVQSKVHEAEIQYRQAQQTADNAKAMLDEGIISKQKYDTLQSATDAAKSDLQSAQAALHLSKSGGRPEERQVAAAQLSAARAQYGQVLRGARPEEMSIASSNVEKARSALQGLQAQTEETRIRAPFAGYISVIGVTEGELVPPGRAVISVLDYSHLWTDVYVPESKLALVGLGKPVTVRAKSYKGSEFNGRVALINPKSEFIPNSGGDSSSEESTFRVKVSVEGKDQGSQTQLYPGMKVDVYFNP
jgi:HlyD family secretion protein